MNERAERLYAAGYWGGRRESLDACVQRTIRLLAGLGGCDEVFSNWFELGSTRKQALKSRIELTPEAIAPIILRGRNRRESDDTVIEEFGYRMGLWTGGIQGRSAALDLKCGAYRSPGPNSCVIRLPYLEPEARRITRVSALSAILRAIVDAWDPEWAVVTSDDFRRAAQDEQPGNFVGWLTYLSTKAENVPRLAPPSYVTELVDGSLIVLASEIVSASDSAQVETAKRLSEIMRKTGLLNPIPPHGGLAVE